MPVPDSVSSLWQWSVPEFQTLCFVYCESVTIKAFNPFNILSLSELKLFWDCWWKMRGRSCSNKWSALIAGAETFPDPELAIWKACRRRLFWQSSWMCRGDRRVLTALWLYSSVSLIGWPQGKVLMHWSNSMESAFQYFGWYSDSISGLLALMAILHSCLTFEGESWTNSRTRCAAPPGHVFYQLRKEVHPSSSFCPKVLPWTSEIKALN